MKEIKRYLRLNIGGIKKLYYAISEDLTEDNKYYEIELRKNSIYNTNLTFGYQKMNCVFTFKIVGYKIEIIELFIKNKVAFKLETNNGDIIEFPYVECECEYVFGEQYSDFSGFIIKVKSIIN